MTSSRVRGAYLKCGVMRDSACVVCNVKDTMVRMIFREIQVVASPVLKVRSLD